MDFAKEHLLAGVAPVVILSDSSSSESEHRAECSVCAEDITEQVQQVHYGAQACFSCRAFFRRAQGATRRPFRTCKRGGNCQVDSKTRRLCAACRYAKCLASGMNPSLVLSEEEKSHRFRKMIKRRKKKARQQNRLRQQRSEELVTAADGGRPVSSGYLVELCSRLSARFEYVALERPATGVLDMNYAQRRCFFSRHTPAYLAFCLVEYVAGPSGFAVGDVRPTLEGLFPAHPGLNSAFSNCLEKCVEHLTNSTEREDFFQLMSCREENSFSRELKLLSHLGMTLHIVTRTFANSSVGNVGVDSANNNSPAGDNVFHLALSRGYDVSRTLAAVHGHFVDDLSALLSDRSAAISALLLARLHLAESLREQLRILGATCHEEDRPAAEAAPVKVFWLKSKRPFLKKSLARLEATLAQFQEAFAGTNSDEFLTLALPTLFFSYNFPERSTASGLFLWLQECLSSSLKQLPRGEAVLSCLERVADLVEIAPGFTCQEVNWESSKRKKTDTR